MLLVAFLVFRGISCSGHTGLAKACSVVLKGQSPPGQGDQSFREVGWDGGHIWCVLYSFFLAPMLLLYELWKLWRSYPRRAETR